ncbi:N-acyl homoserine lactonase AttM [Mycena venus]|uniref:N-acyl homoserine lactonase AttM n=1 Tax=Mycena venus TaxID=2733690 RepID=A0A8H6WY66_9AGAR|nr:N-acyl homoserine lactonase AttM [Mycena venus]
MQPILPAPGTSQAYMDVSALEAGIITLPMALYIKGAPQTEVAVCPSIAFVLRHSVSGKQLVFDLGIPRNTESLPPAVKGVIAKYIPVQVPQDAAESLKKGGLDPADVETVILSHLHFDHIGDHSPFTKATFVIGGEVKDELFAGFPHTPTSDILATSVPLDRTRFLSASEFTTSIGPFPKAIDYFGDGSLYLVDAAGHMSGHINAFARTSSDGSWIYLGSDTAHDVRLLTGEKEVGEVSDPRTPGTMLCAHVNKEVAITHIERVGSLMKVPGVHVLVAHDWRWYEENKGGDAYFPGKIPPKPL